MDGYDVAQVCINGHLINDSYRQFPAKNQSFCSTCGQRTITACERCGKELRGDYHAEGVFGFKSSYEQASFCRGCGAPHPWTETALAAGRELADELDGLSDDERERLKKSFEEIARETPQAEVAATRIKKIMAKVGGEGAKSIGRIAQALATQAAKDVLFGPGT